MRRALFLPLLALPVIAGAQNRPAELLERPSIKSAVDLARVLEPETIEDEIRLCEIEAPPFGEARRASAFADMLRAAGVKNVVIDREGNVVGERAGSAPRPNVVLSAHLDTVFPKGTDVRVKRDGAMLRGPGIGDDCRGLAEVLAVAKAMNKAGVATPGTVTFAATVGEEGLGDLRGVKRLFNETLKGRIDRFISIDGDGLGVTTAGIGSVRYRVTFKGPGGHSFGSFGTVNPVHALGRAVAKIADFQTPGVPRTTFNVGRIGGGTSVNAIAAEAWMEVDLRSADPEHLKLLDARFRQAVEQAAAQENARWNSTQLTVSIESVGARPAGRLPENAPLMQTAAAVQRALAMPLSFEEGSTDANLPFSLNIPAITIGTGGRSDGVHTIDERFNATDAWKGSQRALLLTIALAQP